MFNRLTELYGESALATRNGKNPNEEEKEDEEEDVTDNSTHGGGSWSRENRCAARTAIATL